MTTPADYQEAIMAAAHANEEADQAFQTYEEACAKAKKAASCGWDTLPEYDADAKSARMVWLQKMAEAKEAKAKLHRIQAELERQEQEAFGAQEPIADDE